MIKLLFKYLLFHFLAWAAIALPARAQFVCHVAENGTLGQGTPTYGDYWYTTLSCRGNNVIVAATAESLTGQPGYYLAFLVTRDGGRSWSVETQGLPGPTWSHEPMVNAIDQIDSSDIMAAGDSGLLVRSTDNGATWSVLPVPTTHSIEDISFSDSLNGIFVAADTTHGTYVTTDGGSQWTPVPFTRSYAWRCHADGNGMYRVFVIGTGILYATKDNWKTIDSDWVIADPSNAAQYGFRGCSFGLGETIFAFGVHHTAHLPAPYISMSADGGKEWRTVYDDSGSMWHSGMIYYLSSIERDTIVASGNLLNQVLLSTNGGETWSPDSLICNDSGFLDAGNSGVGFSHSGNLILSFNDGFNSSLIVGRNLSLSVGSAFPSSNALQFYPNPAFLFLEIAGAAPASTVYLLDILGREVLRAKTSAAGMLTLNVSRLPRGVYIIMLEKDGVMIPAGRVILVGE